MSNKKIMLAALFAGASATASAFADEGPVQGPPAGSVSIHADRFEYDARNAVVKATGHAMVTIASTMKQAVLKNAPYTAQIVTEHRQTLADGNQIAGRQSAISYRDSAGRTRYEGFDGKDDPITVTITDPAAGASWVLNPLDHSAVRVSLPAIDVRKGEDGGNEVIVKRVQRADGDARPGAREDVRIEVPQALTATSAARREAQARLTPLAAGAYDTTKWMQHMENRKLGTREIAGVLADGWVQSYDIPAGAIGNSHPITVSDEQWYARDLQITLYSKHSDPRSGDVEFRVEKLTRDEPPAALFTVPAGYTIRNSPVIAAGQGR